MTDFSIVAERATAHRFTHPEALEPTMATTFRGIVPPVCTPLLDNFGVDARSLCRTVDFLLAAGVHGLFVLGSTSEVAYLPDRHRALVVEAVVDHVAGRVPVLVGCIDTTTLRVAEHIDMAGRAGADGVVVTAPFYARTHPAEIELHYRMLRDRTELPIIAYDIPIAVHSKLDSDLVLRLAEDGVLAGIKDSSGADASFRALVLGKQDRKLHDFAVLTGSELLVDTMLALGADGAVPGLANVDPAGFVAVYRHMSNGDSAAARSEQERLLRLFSIVDVGAPDRMGRGSAALGAFKTAMKLRGVIGNAVTAPPQLPLDDGEVEQIEAILAEAGLLP
ncbi:dihydrodipicolinate synthase family protein [Nocardia sp. NBC_00881]|nr:dihydrodipicolinate synthase family protein [Nocardia sp. NBC_00881]